MNEIVGSRRRVTREIRIVDSTRQKWGCSGSTGLRDLVAAHSTSRSVFMEKNVKQKSAGTGQ